MTYSDGQEVKLGDSVKLGQDDGGVVVCSIDTGEYRDDHPEAQWGYLKKGVMVDFPSYGLIHYEESEPDLQLIARAKRLSGNTMKYMSGIEVMEGDIIVGHYGDGPVEGVVLQVLLPNTPDADDWASPNGGVLIEGGGLGLFVHKSLEDAEDIVFVRRANDKP